jgi:hypothetical protein
MRRVEFLGAPEQAAAVRPRHLAANYFDPGASITHAATTCAPLG